MTNHSRRGSIRAAAAAVLSLALVAAAVPAQADDEVAVRNGGFEHSLAGWETSTFTSTAAGWFAYSGRLAPLSGFRVPAPPQGDKAAIADQIGPGSNVLSQLIEVDDDSVLRLSLWYRNRARAFRTPNTLSYQDGANQQLRVDLMRPGASLRSVRPADVLATVFRTRRGDPFRLDTTRLALDLDRFDDQTVRLRVAEVDNLFFFQVGVDAVSVREGDDDGAARTRPVHLVRSGGPVGRTVHPARPYQR